VTTPDTTTLLAQLRAVLDLTNTEIQVAETRVAQARTDAVQRELSQNAANGRAPPRRSKRRSANWAAIPMSSARSSAARPLR
jgi:hypothetical protein